MGEFIIHSLSFASNLSLRELILIIVITDPRPQFCILHFALCILHSFCILHFAFCIHSPLCILHSNAIGVALSPLPFFIGCGIISKNLKGSEFENYGN
ncbi:MAG: hypothetical protein E7544_02515 [Ruminococcaceae bacterium]|nr:hypothetical protein [Oscillospiraceae bacterium]